MANIKSSKKDKIKSNNRRIRNMSQKSKFKTFLKKVNININNKDITNSINSFKIFQSIADRCSTKGIIHKNKVSRHKHNIIKKIKNINS
ncbi:30S ribosomal protein S20 [Buchnera aphidicola (Ceratoglyphina bambusae)]|uniref:30S ribosomal protein S20 n=1 Tax=Buchnera aphidicola TaxID=9 RepID=UPI0031B8A32A